MSEFDGMSLVEAKEWLRARAERGARCPCCTQNAKIYKRPINSGIARALITMYRTSGTDWLYKPSVLKGQGAAARDESIARYWGLIEEELTVRPDGGRSGWWRVTPKGEDWILERLLIQRRAWIYDGRLLKFDGPMVGIRTALGTKFNLNDLMDGTA
jgi:hypothetical protein